MHARGTLLLLTELGPARRIAGKVLRRLLGTANKSIVDFDRFGFDWMSDIQKLCRSWHVTINTVFDVGANVGLTAQALHNAFPDAIVYAFEPHPATFQRLRERCVKYGRLIPIELALCSETSTRTLHDFGPNGSEIASLIPDPEFARRFCLTHSDEITIQTTSIDEFVKLRNISSIGILKIDAEGVDIDVLRGASEALTNGSIGFVYIEYNRVSSSAENGGSSLCEYDELLNQYGFSFVASYTDYVVAESPGQLFFVANALYALKPNR